MAAELQADFQKTNEMAKMAYLTLNTEKDEQLSKFYTEDCRVMVPGTGTILAREDLVKTMKMLVAQGFEWKVIIDEVGPLGSGDMFYERGHTEWAHSDSTKTHYNKYLVLRKKIDENFLVHTLIFNDNGKPDGPSADPSSLKC